LFWNKLFFRQIRNENEKRRRDLFSQLITNLGDVISTNRTSSSNQLNKLSKNAILRQTVAFLQQHQHSKNIFFVCNNNTCIIKLVLTSETKMEICKSSSTCSNRVDMLDLLWKPCSDIIDNEEWLQIAIEVISLINLNII